MLQDFYPFILIALLSSIIWWFYSINRNPDSKTRLPSMAFWLSVLSYAFVLYISSFSFWYKILLMLPRDIVIMLAIFLIANNTKTSFGFFMALVVTIFGTYTSHSGLGHRVYTYFYQPDVDAKAELLFEMNSETNMQTIKSNLSKYNLKIKQAFPKLKNKDYSDLEQFYVVDISENNDMDIRNIANMLYATTGASVEYNEIVKLSPMEKKSQDVSETKSDYIIDDEGLNKLWGFEQMKVNSLYQFLKSKNIKAKKKAKIAILDTGVDAKHEDIEARYISTKRRYDRDIQSHGTHCAGIAASVSNNGKGIASLALNNSFVEVTSIKVLSDQGSGTDRGIIAGIIEAADNGADVISMSLGGPSTDSKQRAFAEAVKYAQKSGAIVVVAAGNENQDAVNATPANVEGVITVSAVDRDLSIASFSNYITNIKMGIAAPGVEIYSTIPSDKYAAYSGTSMATPYVAGLLGLMKSLKPDLDTKTAYGILKSTGIDTKNTEKTGKFIQPLKAIQEVVK